MPVIDPGSAAEDDRRGERALGGWSPPPLPAGTSTKRCVDQVLSRSTVWLLIVAAIIALFGFAALVTPREARVADGVAALLGGATCSLNFWRCRHVHCLVTGAGWLCLGAAGLVGAAVGHSVVGGWEQPLFAAVLALGLVFEGGWYLAHGTNALVRGCSPGSGKPGLPRQEPGGPVGKALDRRTEFVRTPPDGP